MENIAPLIDEKKLKDKKAKDLLKKKEVSDNNNKINA